MADTVTERVVVRADPDTVFDVIGDVASYPQWQDEIKSVEVLESDEDGWPSRVRFVLDAKIFTATFVLEYAYTDSAISWTLVEGDQLRRNDGSYELADQGDGSTLLTYSLVIEPSVPVPGMLRRRAAKRIVDGALNNVKARAESRA
jgi:ribosome-associated toxin RatA of RatAB toxin-antitoxin module